MRNTVLFGVSCGAAWLGSSLILLPLNRSEILAILVLLAIVVATSVFSRWISRGSMMLFVFSCGVAWLGGSAALLLLNRAEVLALLIILAIMLVSSLVSFVFPQPNEEEARIFVIAMIIWWTAPLTLAVACGWGIGLLLRSKPAYQPG